MIAASITFEEMETRAERTFALAILVKSVRDGVRACMIGFILLPYLSHTLSAIVKGLTSEFLEKISDAQALELAGRLQKLHGSLLGLVRRFDHRNMTRIPVLGKAVIGIEESTEEISDIVESIYLSLDPTFHKLVSSAIAESKSTVKDIETMHR